MPITRDKASGCWAFDFDRWIKRPNGTSRRYRRHRILPAGWTRAQADAFDLKESSAISAIAEGVAKPRHLIGEAVRRYLSERAPQLKNGRALRGELIGPPGAGLGCWYAGRSIDELPDVCAAYARDQLGHLAPATIKNRIAYLRAACRWAWKRHGMGDSDPGARVTTPPVNNARDVTVTSEQVEQLAVACEHPGVRALIRVLYYSGMRVSEAQRAKRAPGAFVLLDTKNGSPRIVPMVKVIAADAQVKMPRRSEIDYWWPKAREACGLPHVRLHDLRHAAASAMVNAGIDLGTVGAVLGHKSTATTKRYSHHGTERLAQALATIGKKVPVRAKRKTSR